MNQIRYKYNLRVYVIMKRSCDVDVDSNADKQDDNEESDKESDKESDNKESDNKESEHKNINQEDYEPRVTLGDMISDLDDSEAGTVFLNILEAYMVLILAFYLFFVIS